MSSAGYVEWFFFSLDIRHLKIRNCYFFKIKKVLDLLGQKTHWDRMYFGHDKKKPIFHERRGPCRSSSVAVQPLGIEQLPNTVYSHFTLYAALFVVNNILCMKHCV